MGKHFQVQGPLNIERPPQGHPVIVQAGSSEDGKELAAATAEAIFTAWTSLAEAQAFYRDVKGRMAKFGRRPEQLLVLPGISPVIGRTQAEADGKWAQLQSLIHPSVGLNTLQPFWPDDDLTRWKLDAPPPYIPQAPQGIRSRAHVVLELARRGALHRAPALRITWPARAATGWWWARLRPSPTACRNGSRTARPTAST